MKEYSLNKELRYGVERARNTHAKVEERRRVEVEKSLDALAVWLDDLVRIPVIGWRFGLDAIIGFIPGVGDTVTTIASFYILVAGVRHGVPKITLLRMALNIAIDYLVGAIPFVGDAFDFIWKSNSKNLELLKERATLSSDEQRSGRLSDWIFVGGIMLLLVGILAGSLFLAALLWAVIATQLAKLF